MKGRLIQSQSIRVIIASIHPAITRGDPFTSRGKSQETQSAMLRQAYVNCGMAGRQVQVVAAPDDESNIPAQRTFKQLIPIDASV